MKPFNNKIRGFTLIELLLAMSLTVLVGGVIYLLQSSGLTTVKRGMTQLTLTGKLRNKVEQMVAELRCTKEILKVTESSIKIRCYDYSIDHSEPGENSLITVTYEVEKSGKRFVLWKTINRRTPVKLITAKMINTDIFHPYFEAYDVHSPTLWSYYSFDMKSNDSGQRKRISFIRIKLSLSDSKDVVALATSVKLRPAASIVKQPNWKYR